LLVRLARSRDPRVEALVHIVRQVIVIVVGVNNEPSAKLGASETTIAGGQDDVDVRKGPVSLSDVKRLSTPRRNQTPVFDDLLRNRNIRCSTESDFPD